SEQTRVEDLPCVKPGDVMDLTRRLCQANLLDNVSPFHLKSLERHRVRKTPEPEDGRGCIAITPDVEWTGDSHQLAIAVGIYAAARGYSVPPWVLFSGSLENNSVHTGSVGELAQKVRIALGCGPGYEHLSDIVERMYDRDDTAQCL